MAAEWQPIETAPVGSDVLVFCPDAVDWALVTICHQLDCEEDGLVWYGQDADNQPEPLDVEPTHWMPLPAPPKLTTTMVNVRRANDD